MLLVDTSSHLRMLRLQVAEKRQRFLDSKKFQFEFNLMFYVDICRVNYTMIYTTMYVDVYTVGYFDF